MSNYNNNLYDDEFFYDFYNKYLNINESYNQFSYFKNTNNININKDILNKFDNIITNFKNKNYSLNNFISQLQNKIESNYKKQTINDPFSHTVTNFNNLNQHKHKNAKYKISSHYNNFNNNNLNKTTTGFVANYEENNYLNKSNKYKIPFDDYIHLLKSKSTEFDTLKSSGVNLEIIYEILYYFTINKYNFVESKDTLIYNDQKQYHYLGIKDNHIQFYYPNNNIKDINNVKNINWDILKELYINPTELPKSFDIKIMIGVIGLLRQFTVEILLEHIDNILRTNNRGCFVNIGSTNPTSDLDFTYVDYNNPLYNPIKLYIFNKLFHKIYNDTSDNVFDTNFYITSAIIEKNCYDSINDNILIKNLFNKILNKNIYRLYFTGNDTNSKKYQLLDMINAFNTQNDYIKSLSKQNHKNFKKEKYDKLMKNSLLFYFLIDLYNNKELKIDINDFILKLREVFYNMCVNSNESYIYDGTVLDIVFQNTSSRLIYKNNSNINNSITKSISRKNINSNINLEYYLMYFNTYLKFIDNYIFIEEYKHKYLPTNNSILFFDRISKYVLRFINILEGSNFLNSNTIYYKYKNFTGEWVRNIRGKKSLNNMNITFTKRISDNNKINFINKFYYDIHNIFENINMRFNILSESLIN